MFRHHQLTKQILAVSV